MPIKVVQTNDGYRVVTGAVHFLMARGRGETEVEIEVNGVIKTVPIEKVEL